jgi:signal transduction histidine kinase
VLVATHRPRFEEALKTELGNITLPGEGERAARLQRLYGDYVPVLRQVLDPAIPAGQRRGLYFQRLYPTFQQIKGAADEILRMNERNMVQAKDRARRVADDAGRVMALLLFAGIAFAGAAVLFLSQAVLVPLERLEGESGTGKPGPAVPLTLRDEPRPFHPEPVPPAELVDAAVSEATPGFREEGVKLAVDVDPEAPRVLADRDQVRPALAALLKNARAHSPAGGTVTLTAGPWEGRVRFAVADTGSGIPAAHQERIFEPFYQVPGTQDLGEVGLGLAVARGIVQSHGGEIHVESEEGRGATFWFTLPAAVG